MVAQELELKIVNTVEQMKKKGVQHWFRWSIYLDADKEILNKIDRVVYHLHPSFPVKDITVGEERRQEGFKLDTQGWGIFNIFLDIFLKDGTKITASHYLSFDKDPTKRITELKLQALS